MVEKEFHFVPLQANYSGMRYLHLIWITFLVVATGLAQDDSLPAKKNVFEKVAGQDSVSGGYIKFYNDKRFEKAVVENRSIGAPTTAGYRVQVFSSNVQKTAKDEAFKIEQDLREIFPEIPVYVSYTSPFWKVRMGDFRTIEQAKKFRIELLEVFPELKSATYTVKDQVFSNK